MQYRHRWIKAPTAIMMHSAGLGAGMGVGAGARAGAATKEAAAIDVLYGLDEMSTKVAGMEHAKGVSTGVRGRFSPAAVRGV